METTTMPTSVTGLGPRPRSSPRTSRRRSRVTLTSCERRLRRLKPRLRSIDAVRSAPAVIEGAAPLPGWEPLRALLLDAVRCADAFEEGRSLPRSQVVL